MDDLTPAQRLRAAADLIESTLAEASPTPWTYFEDHGRDYTDEGWSDVGTLDAEGQHNSMTYAPGYEANDRPEHDASLLVLMSAAATPLVPVLREVAHRYDMKINTGADGGVLALADAVMTQVVRVSR